MREGSVVFTRIP